MPYCHVKLVISYQCKLLCVVSDCPLFGINFVLRHTFGANSLSVVRNSELSASRELLKYYMYGNLIPFQEGCPS